MSEARYPRITNEEANAFAVGGEWPRDDLTVGQALRWLAADLLDARYDREQKR